LKTKIILSLLLLCLFAAPGSAWELGFEEHPDDEFSVHGADVCMLSSFNLASSGTNSRIYYSGTTSTPSFTAKIHLPVEDYLAFSVTTAAGNTANTVSVSFFNGTIQVGSCTIYSIYSSITTSKRITITKGTGSTWYYLLDGAGGGTFSIPDGEQITSFMVSVSNGANTQKTYTLDDFSTDDTFQLGFDSPSATGSQLTVTSGTHPMAGFEFSRTFEDSDGNIISSSSLSSTTGSSSITLPTTSGEYTMRIRGIDTTNPNSPNYILYSKSLLIEGTDAIDTRLELNKELYNPGETVRIFSHVSPYSAGYSIKIKYADSLYKNFDITTEDQYTTWVLPSDTLNYIFVYLLNPSGNIVQFAQFEVFGSTPTPKMTIDKTSYYNSESIKVSYQNMRPGVKLSATYYNAGQKLDTSTIILNDLNGIEFFSIGGRSADSVIINALGTTELYASETAKILYGNYYVSGKVLNAATGAAVPGALVWTPGFTVTTDETGAYGHKTGPGSLNVTISADGYETAHVSMYVNSINTVKDFYITPNYVSNTGASLYGIITDYYTGEALSGCNIKLSQGATTHYTITNNKGYYVSEYADLSGTWVLKITKSGYDTYSQNISISGDTYCGVRLVPSGGAPGAVPDDGGTTPDSTDRPSREAAKESLTWLEETIPGLVKLAVIVFMLALVGWRF